MQVPRNRFDSFLLHKYGTSFLSDIVSWKYQKDYRLDQVIDCPYSNRIEYIFRGQNRGDVVKTWENHLEDMIEEYNSRNNKYHITQLFNDLYRYDFAVKWINQNPMVGWNSEVDNVIEELSVPEKKIGKNKRKLMLMRIRK